MNSEKPGTTIQRTRPFMVAGWRVDPSSLRISKGSQTRKLEPKAMALLCLLAERPGVVLTRQQLEASVWAGTVVGYDALSNAIIKLRKAFGDKARDARVIETIAKSGYRLIAPVETPAGDSAPDLANPGMADSADSRLPRKLAAILYADVVDYSRLTREDEDATHHALGEYLDRFSALIEENRGRVMHFAGDAILAMFGAAVDAVNCAREVQREFAAWNDARPAGRGLQFRIGVNSGDVFEDRGDVYGDGVNIAARLEGLAPAGGICVSESVRSAVGNRMGIEFRFDGEHSVKNIDEPVRVYAVESPAEARDDRAADYPPLPARPSIAVLPFDNMSGDPEQEYFSDGIVEDITTDLAKLSGLLVIARNSAFAYKGTTRNLTDIGRELGVAYLLEGSVRRAEQRIRVNAQLIDCATGGHLWAERYDRDLTDLFSVQDELTRAIVAALTPALTGSEQRGLELRESRNIEAYDYFLKGREQSLLDTEPSNALACSLLEKAIEIDPAFSSAYAYLGRCYGVAYINDWGDPAQQSLHKGLELGQKAVALDPANPFAHFTVAVIAFWLKNEQLAMQAIDTALEIRPNFAEGYGALGMFQLYSGEPARALESLQTAMRLDPHYRDILLHLQGQACFHLGRYTDAVAALTRRLVRKPESDVSRVLLAASYGHLGEPDKGRAEYEEALRINPGYSLEQKRSKLPYSNPADFEHIVEGLRRAGIDVSEAGGSA